MAHDVHERSIERSDPWLSRCRTSSHRDARRSGGLGTLLVDGHEALVEDVAEHEVLRARHTGEVGVNSEGARHTEAREGVLERQRRRRSDSRTPKHRPWRGPQEEAAARAADGPPPGYFTRRSTETQFDTPEPPTLNVTPIFGVFFVGASPTGSSMSCL